MQPPAQGRSFQRHVLLFKKQRWRIAENGGCVFPGAGEIAEVASPHVQEAFMQTSARNQLSGEVVAFTRGSVNDEVVLRTTDGLDVAAIITHGSSLSLDLAVGKAAVALVKASSVLIMVDTSAAQVSARNCVGGVVKAITKGAVNSEVIVEAPGGAQIASIITNNSVERLNLSVGKPATAVFKASSVIIAIDA